MADAPSAFQLQETTFRSRIITESIVWSRNKEGKRYGVALVEPRGVWLLPKAPVTDTPLLTSGAVEETSIFGVAFENMRTPPHRDPSSNVFDKSFITGSETITITEQDDAGIVINDAYTYVQRRIMELPLDDRGFEPLGGIEPESLSSSRSNNGESEHIDECWEIMRAAMRVLDATYVGMQAAVDALAPSGPASPRRRTPASMGSTFASAKGAMLATAQTAAEPPSPMGFGAERLNSPVPSPARRILTSAGIIASAPSIAVIASKDARSVAAAIIASTTEAGRKTGTVHGETFRPSEVVKHSSITRSNEDWLDDAECALSAARRAAAALDEVSAHLISSRQIRTRFCAAGDDIAFIFTTIFLICQKVNGSLLVSEGSPTSPQFERHGERRKRFGGATAFLRGAYLTALRACLLCVQTALFDSHHVLESINLLHLRGAPLKEFVRSLGRQIHSNATSTTSQRTEAMSDTALLISRIGTMRNSQTDVDTIYEDAFGMLPFELIPTDAKKVRRWWFNSTDVPNYDVEDTHALDTLETSATAPHGGIRRRSLTNSDVVPAKLRRLSLQAESVLRAQENVENDAHTLEDEITELAASVLMQLDDTLAVARQIGDSLSTHLPRTLSRHIPPAYTTLPVSLTGAVTQTSFKPGSLPVALAACFEQDADIDNTLYNIIDTCVGKIRVAIRDAIIAKSWWVATHRSYRHDGTEEPTAASSEIATDYIPYSDNYNMEPLATTHYAMRLPSSRSNRSLKISSSRLGIPERLHSEDDDTGAHVEHADPPPAVAEYRNPVFALRLHAYTSLLLRMIRGVVDAQTYLRDKYSHVLRMHLHLPVVRSGNIFHLREGLFADVYANLLGIWSYVS